MKGLLTILFFIFTLAAEAQLTGDGTFANPWSGTLAGDATWSGTVYINNDITVDNETLTINPGATVIFLAEAADLKITGTGSLQASGSSSQKITFTADDDNDGSYGESGERWGHISFDGMGAAPSSQISYCIIEYGYKDGSSIEGYGGGLQLNYSSVTVSDCILRNNYAQWGGGLFVNASRNPAVSNCIFKSNQSLHAGGGAYCWNGSSSVFTNCLFDGNQCLEPTVSYYTGGGLAAQSSTSVKVVNCTFVNNTSLRTEGQAIMIYGSTGARVVNSIFWGNPEKQVFLYSTSAGILINNAYRGATYTSGSPVNPVILNSSNSASDGPNFVATDGSDWSVRFISPCRDAGVNSYTGITVPTADFEGNPRIGTKDIGTYETQYSRWSGSTSNIWSTSSNWEGNVDPASGTGDVYIPSGLTNYPTGSTSQDFTLGSGNQFIIEPGGRVTLDDLTNNGTLKLNHTSSGFASLILNSYARGGGGTEEIELYLSGGGSELLEDYKWHYISTPVSSLSTNTFTGVTLDLAQFVESRPALSLLQGWVAFDGYVYSTGLTNGPTFNALTPGKGYNFWDGVDNTFTFSGTFNTSNVTMPLPYSGVPSLHGYNLLGNPFSSGLNWDDVANGVYFAYPSNTSKGIYFTRDNQQCSYINGVGTPGDVTGIIPPMQGFFTKTYSTGNSITLPIEARTHSGIHARYKGESVIPLIRLSLKEDAVLLDEAVVRFDELAKTGLDNDFDAVKLFVDTAKTQIYTISSGTKFAINGIPYPGSSLVIPVPVSIAKDNYYTLQATLQGLDDYYVKLIDKETGIIADLRMLSFITFQASARKYDNRFELVIVAKTSAENPVMPGGEMFSIYEAGGLINVERLAGPDTPGKGEIRVLDITGRTVGVFRNEEFVLGTPVRVTAPGSTGIYIVEVKSGRQKFVRKIIIR